MHDQSKPYAPLTADNAALVLVDHQVGLMTGVRDYETGELKHNVVALAKAAVAAVTKLQSAEVGKTAEAARTVAPMATKSAPVAVTMGPGGVTGVTVVAAAA